MMVLRQEKKRCTDFLNKLMHSYELIAPVKKEVVRFEKIENTEDIHLEKNSYFPVKEYFFRRNEVLFKFDGAKIIAPKYETPNRVFFGLRKCDLNGIKRQDMVFIDYANDIYYKAARQNSFLIGYHCNEALSQYCFCGSMDLVDFFDLMFYDKDDYFLVEVGSEKGRFLIEKYKEFFTISAQTLTQEDKKIKNTDRLKTKDISGLYEHPGWKKGVDNCLSCSACTALCPTCYCFEMRDEVFTKNCKEGERKRDWSSCQVQEFTRIAGNYIFRKEREERFKHRIYHQLEYFKQKYGVNLCVGCGRCIEGCPTRIDFVEIINGMKNEAKSTQQ